VSPGVGPQPNFGLSIPGQCTRNVAGNDEGNKATEIIFTGSRTFIILADSGEIISQSPKSRSVSGAGLNAYKVCPPTFLQNVVTVTENIAELAGGLQLCRASRKLPVDSEWGNQDEY
jgi:hypothetical protein